MGDVGRSRINRFNLNCFHALRNQRRLMTDTTRVITHPTVVWKSDPSLALKSAESQMNEVANTTAPRL